MRLRRTLFAAIAIIAGPLAVNAQEVTVKVGTVRSISTATILWGVEKGYFKEHGINVVTETLDTAAKKVAATSLPVTGSRRSVRMRSPLRSISST